MLVTGGSRGLGLALSRELVREGARLVLLARDPEELRRAREELRERGGDVLALQCDVTDAAAVEEAVTIALDWYGRIDAVINSAGVIEIGPFDAMGIDDFAVGMATHFWAPLHLARAVVPVMRAQGGGRIVNVSSIGGVVAVPHLAAYSASKFALTGLSEALRAELAKDGIRVTTVVPGLMRTGSGRAAWIKGDARGENAWFRASAVLPFVTVSAERAARRIVRALARGEAHVVVGAPARLAAIAHGLFPGLVQGLLAAVDRALPRSPPAASAEPVSADTLSAPLAWLRRVDDRLAAAHNETALRV